MKKTTLLIAALLISASVFITKADEGMWIPLLIEKMNIQQMQENGFKLSAEDIYLAVHKFYSNIGLTTVYRNLEMLVNIGMVVKFDFGEGRSKYELSEQYNGKGHHHHLVCKKCFRVIDYSDFMQDEVKFLKSTVKGLSEKYNFNITDHLIQFLGICEKCEKE